MTDKGVPSAGGIHPAAVGGRVQRTRKKRVRKPVEGAEVVKHRVAVTEEGTPAVIDSKNGPVTFFDKVKKYYKFLIAAVGALLIVLNEATPLFNTLGGSGEKWFTGIVAVVASIGVLLKSNERWVNAL